MVCSDLTWFKNAAESRERSERPAALRPVEWHTALARVGTGVINASRHAHPALSTECDRPEWARRYKTSPVFLNSMERPATSGSIPFNGRLCVRRTVPSVLRLLVAVAHTELLMLAPPPPPPHHRHCALHHSRTTQLCMPQCHEHGRSGGIKGTTRRQVHRRRTTMPSSEYRGVPCYAAVLHCFIASLGAMHSASAQ